MTSTTNTETSGLPDIRVCNAAGKSKRTAVALRMPAGTVTPDGMTVVWAIVGHHTDPETGESRMRVELTSTDALDDAWTPLVSTV